MLNSLDPDGPDLGPNCLQWLSNGLVRALKKFTKEDYWIKQ